jgi:hypothetical protein
MDTKAVQATQLHRRAHQPHSPHRWPGQRGVGHAASAAGIAGAFPGGSLCKGALRVSGRRPTRRQVEPLSTFMGSGGGRLNFLTIAANQLTCPDTLSAIRLAVLPIQPVVIDGVSVLWDTARGMTRPLVPWADWQQVFAAIHGLAHPGTRATRRLMTSRVIWRGMTSDIARWVRECKHCSRGKVTSQPAAPVQPIQVPDKNSRLSTQVEGSWHAS